MSITPAQRLEFRQSGFVVIDSEIPEETLDAVVDELAPYWGPDRIEPPGAAASLPNRIQDYWRMNRHVHAVATAPAVLEALEQLYDRRPRPFQTLNFHSGTEQKVHADSIHFNSEPFGLVCGVWVAREDIGPDQGPLVYYPGSQDFPEMNFEHFGLEPSYEPQRYHEYEVAIERLIADRRLRPEYGTIRKGEALIWAANLLHGGAPQLDPSLARRSQVTHCYFDGAKPWRPGYSTDGRAYFEPEWIPPAWSPPAPATTQWRSTLRQRLRPRTRLIELRRRLSGS